MPQPCVKGGEGGGKRGEGRGEGGTGIMELFYSGRPHIPPSAYHDAASLLLLNGNKLNALTVVLIIYSLLSSKNTILIFLSNFIKNLQNARIITI